jgi:hypothetical protein
LLRVAGKEIQMNKLMMSAALAGATMIASAASADHGGVRVGTLTCHEAPGWGYVLGSSHRVNCTFSGNENDRVERYTGDIGKLGVDVGYQKSAVIVWGVFAPTSSVRQGDLAGHYGGASANAAIGPGVGANVLIGGFNKSFTLQPVSLEGRTGVDIAAGVAGLTLKPVR